MLRCMCSFCGKRQLSTETPCVQRGCCQAPKCSLCAVHCRKPIACTLTVSDSASPAQALWQLAAVSKSTVYARQEAAAAILSSAKRHSEADAGVQRLLQRFPEVVDQLIRLCNHTSGDKR